MSAVVRIIFTARLTRLTKDAPMLWKQLAQPAHTKPSPNAKPQILTRGNALLTAPVAMNPKPLQKFALSALIKPKKNAKKSATIAIYDEHVKKPATVAGLGKT